jgi:general secretion pathway protein F
MQRLSYRERADLYARLATMEHAGMPPAQAFATLASAATEALAQRYRQVQRAVTAGRELADAGRRAGLFSEMDAKLLHVATTGGSPERTYRRLAEHYRVLDSQVRRLKSRLALPVVVLVLACFIRPLPGLVVGTLSAWDYSAASFGVLLPLALFAYAGIRLPIWLRDGPLRRLGLSHVVSGLALTVPLFGPRNAQRNVVQFLDSLALLVEAGMPILDALEVAEETVANALVRRDLATIRERIQGGMTFHEAFSQCAYVDPMAANLALAGERSGSLPELLIHYVEIERTALADFDDQVFQWIPRLVYGLVAAWIVSGLQGGIAPAWPEPEGQYLQIPIRDLTITPS